MNHVVFADPDNGMEPRAGLPRARLTGPKYTYFHELAPYLDRGQSLIIYHHLHRSMVQEGQVCDRLSQVEESLGRPSRCAPAPGRGGRSSSCPQTPTERCSTRGPPAWYGTAAGRGTSRSTSRTVPTRVCLTNTSN